MTAPMALGEAHRLDVVGCVDLLEADETAVGIGEQIETVIDHKAPCPPIGQHLCGMVDGAMT